MRRNLDSLSRSTFDLAVVGGGIFGIFAACDAARRGLSVAIVERTDWTHAASANCFKIVHGGIRYLQHGDIPRLRQSSRERSILLRTAPHLVRPLPILIPTYGHGRNGKAILAAGVLAYDLATWDRNRDVRDPARRIPPSRLLAREEVRRLYPGLPAEGLTGGALFHDGQMASPARLGLAVLRSAVDAGAEAANYVAATGFLREGDRVTGITAEDRETGATFDVRARFVLNAAGAWSEPLLDTHDAVRPDGRATFSRDAFFVLPRRIGPDIALAVKGKTRDPDAFLSREARHLFLVPWRQSTIVGVWHVVYTGPPDQVTLPEQDLRAFLDEINWAYPGLQARLDEVTVAPHGLVLFGENVPAARDLRYGKRSRIIDHAHDHGIEGLMTLIGVRYTTARLEAERVIDTIVRRLGRSAAPCTTSTAPVHGGGIDDVEAHAREARTRRPREVPEAAFESLLRTHGTAYDEILALTREEPGLLEPLGSGDVLAAEVTYAVRHEMARRLSDVICRRTDLGNESVPTAETLQRCATIMAREAGWSDEQRVREMNEARAAFRHDPLEARSWN